MLDLDALHYQNQLAHLAAVERAFQGSQPADGVAHSPIFPLANISRLLMVGPPSLSHLVDLIENSDIVADFLELIREFLPEHEAFIMAQDEDGRIREFAYYFSQQYFPLSDNLELNEFTLGDFLQYIPVDLMGFSYEDWHEFQDFREGYILMLSLVESPWAEDEDGGHVSILDRVSELVGRDLVELIPAEGWSVADLHQMLDETDYKGVTAFAEWVNSETECWLLDATYDCYEGEQWSRRVVDQLTVQWPQVVAIQDDMLNMSVWLEESLRDNFAKVLVLLQDRQPFIIPKEQIPFPLDENGEVLEKEVSPEGD